MGSNTLGGYNGRLLRVNLSDRKISIDEPPADYFQRYLGGRGFIVTTLLKEVAGGIDAFGPENKLIFALGPLTGMPLMGTGRNSVGAKSPLTGAFGEAEAGGFWGAELKKAGFDVLVFVPSIDEENGCVILRRITFTRANDGNPSLAFLYAIFSLPTTGTKL